MTDHVSAGEDIRVHFYSGVYFSLQLLGRTSKPQAEIKFPPKSPGSIVFISLHCVSFKVHQFTAMKPESSTPTVPSESVLWFLTLNISHGMEREGVSGERPTNPRWEI